MRKLVLLLAAAAGAASCVPEAGYLYHPAEQATAILAGRPAARYGIPPESPRGSVRVATFGVRTLESRSGTIRALRVRLTIANNDDAGPWEVDADALRVAYGSGDVVGPACVRARPFAARRVEIAPGDEAIVDAWFALPAGAEDAMSVPRFDLLWRVRTPARDVAERTPFELFLVEPEVG
jgi:hypothetical protein